MVFLLFKKILKIVICLPVKHLKFLWTRLNVSVRSRSNLNLEVLGEGITGVPGKKLLGAREKTNNQLNPLMALMPGFEPGPHWWEAPLFTLCWSVSSGINMQWCHWLLLSIQGEVIYLLLDLAFVWPEELCRSWRV